MWTMSGEPSLQSDPASSAWTPPVALRSQANVSGNPPMLGIGFLLDLLRHAARLPNPPRDSVPNPPFPTLPNSVPCCPAEFRLDPLCVVHSGSKGPHSGPAICFRRQRDRRACRRAFKLKCVCRRRTTIRLVKRKRFGTVWESHFEKFNPSCFSRSCEARGSRRGYMEVEKTTFSSFALRRREVSRPRVEGAEETKKQDGHFKRGPFSHKRLVSGRGANADEQFTNSQFQPSANGTSLTHLPRAAKAKFWRFQMRLTSRKDQSPQSHALSAFQATCHSRQARHSKEAVSPLCADLTEF